jgi:riboflavin kinase/FMN adenylyltransferase
MEVIKHLATLNPSPCVATIGFFDGVHIGHRYLIERVKNLAHTKGSKSVLITFSVPPRQIIDKKYIPQLLTTYSEKEDLLSKTGVDECIVLDFSSELSRYSSVDFMGEVLKKRIGVQNLVIGYDNHFGHDTDKGFDDYVRYGIKLGIAVEGANPFSMNGIVVSSSYVRRMLKDGNIVAATEALGYPYFINGKVVGGHHIGNRIGFPTANLSVDASKIIPRVGVYAVKVKIGEAEYGGMLNIGHRPTMNNGNDCSIEVNIFNFNKDIYGSTIKVYNYVETTT